MISPKICHCIHPFFRNYGPVSTPSSYCIGNSVIKDTVSSYCTKYTICSVPLDMLIEGRRLVAWKVGLCALMLFLASVNEGVSLQITFQPNDLLHLWAIELLDTTVSLFVIKKATTFCKCLRTHVTGYLFCHLQVSPPHPPGVCFWLSQKATFPFELE